MVTVIIGIGTKILLFWQTEIVNTPGIVGNIYILTFITQQTKKLHS